MGTLLTYSSQCIYISIYIYGIINSEFGTNGIAAVCLYTHQYDNRYIKSEIKSIRTTTYISIKD